MLEENKTIAKCKKNQVTYSIFFYIQIKFSDICDTDD